MSDRQCVDCGQHFPLSRTNYRVKKDGSWDTRCVVCRAKVNRGKRKKQRAKDMAAIEDGALDAFAKAAGRGGENIPHSSEVLEHLMQYFGGSNGFAAMMVKQYFDSPPGGSTRTKIAEAMLRLVTKNTELGGAKKPLTQWSDEELESELDQRLGKIAMTIQAGGIFNVQVAPQTPSDFAAAVGQALGHVPAERIEGDAGGVGEPPHRSLEALPADTEAGGGSPVPGE